MKCPNCGMYLEDNRKRCIMCGEEIDPSNIIEDDDEDEEEFSSNSDFSNNSMGMNNYNEQKKAYQDRFNDYKKINLDDFEGQKMDIFDIFSKYKTTIRIALIGLLIIGVGFGIYFYSNYKNNSKKTKPLIYDLYYELDDSFKLQTDNISQKKYVKTVNNSQCIITIDGIKDTSLTHADSFFIDMKKSIEPKADSHGEINPLSEYQDKSSKKVVNGIEWKTLNIFYRATEEGEFTILKYKYLSSTYNGYSYDIALINENNNETCNVELDNFLKSLKYIDTE